MKINCVWLILHISLILILTVYSLLGAANKNKLCTSVGDASGVHKIGFSNYSFDALCDSETIGPGWTVIQQRINGTEDFNRTWDEYSEGFGSLDGDFFLGLEKIHRLTSTQPHELYVHLEDFQGEITYANYTEFAIAGESDKYRLIRLGEAFGNARNDFLYKGRNQPFTTYDEDNDNYIVGNCARLHNGGWWYNNCGYGLNGRFAWIVKMLIHPVKT